MANKNGSPAKRKKQKDRTLKLKRHAFIADEFVVYAIDGVSAGVKWIRTGEETKVAPLEADILEKSRAEFRVWVGAIGRIDGEEKIELVEMTTSRCQGTELTPHLSRIATEQAQLIGKDHVLTTFYFATSNKTAPFEDWQVYQWLQEAGTFTKLCTYKEYVMDTLNAMIAKVEDMKTKVDAVQVGGSHYSRLEIQPRHLYIPLQLHWDFANALKYITRFEYKNGAEDLKKAWDYIARLQIGGVENFKRKRKLKADVELFERFNAQFRPEVKEILDKLKDLLFQNILTSDIFNSLTTNILFNITAMCKGVYDEEAF